MGIILIALDITFMVMSFFSICAVLYLLRSILSRKESSELMNGTKVVPSNGGANKVLPFSRWNTFDHVKAMDHAKVEKTEKASAKAHDAAVKAVKVQQASAHVRLMGRVKKRNSTVAGQHASSTKRKERATKDDTSKQKSRTKMVVEQPHNFLRQRVEGDGK